VDEGSLKQAFQAGITEEDFELHDEEFRWLFRRAERRKPITPRVFKNAFPEFDFIVPRERLGDLLDELKQERVYIAVSSCIEEALENLTQENAVEVSETVREVLGRALKIHSPNSDIFIKGGWNDHYQQLRRMHMLGENHEITGIPTELTHFDHHFGGWQKETTYLVLGRPGDAKSFCLAKAATAAAWNGYRVGFFSPEMTEHQHRCRFATLLSAKSEVQAALGLKGAFRNRALKAGQGFNLKSYQKFQQWMEREMKGEIALFTQKYRRQKMSLAYIESRIEDYGLDMVIVDPIYKLRPPVRRGSRWEELAEIVDGLVDLSHSYNIPVLMSNQANRALVGKRGDAPDKDSSFGSDSPVQEANVVFGVKHYSEERVMKIVCSKNRDGEAFRFTVAFHPNVGKMDDVTPLKGFSNGYDPEKVHELQKELKA